jgi:K+-sensing histidine kinase KdpD
MICNSNQVGRLTEYERVPEGSAVFSFFDNGPGIAATVVPQIFERFTEQIERRAQQIAVLLNCALAHIPIRTIPEYRSFYPPEPAN